MSEKRYQADYLRLSVEDGDIISDSNKVESNSITHQRALIAQFRKKEKLYPGIEILEFVDDGYSGTNFERPAIRKMLSLVKEGKICCVVVKDLSRFGRNYLEVSDYLEQIFPFLGVRFIAINDGYDSDNYAGTTGGVEFALKNLLYEMYSRDLSEKMRSTLTIQRKRGDFIGPRPPFGYRFSQNKKVLEPDPVSAQYVRRVFELACLGYTTGMIAKKLNEEKIPSPGRYKQYNLLDEEGFWESSSVRKILRNKVYLGTVVNGKSRVTKVGGKRFKAVAEEEQICIPDRHEAIVSEQDFYEASQVIQNRGKQKGVEHQHPRRQEALLLGKLRCGVCRRCLVYCPQQMESCFVCKRVLYDAGCSCFPGKIKESEAEAFVYEQVNQRLKQLKGFKEYIEPDTSCATVEAPDTNLSDAKMRERIKKELESLKLEKQFFYRQLKQNQIGQESYRRKVEIVRERELQLKRQLLQQRSDFNPKEDCKDQQEDAAAESRIPVKLTTKLMDVLIDNVYVHRDGKLEIEWKNLKQNV